MSYVSYKTDIGMGTIIQSNTILEHHNVIGKCCNINSNVTTGGFTFIGNSQLYIFQQQLLTG